MNALSPLDRIRIILCQTSHPGNIGATARAMKTMGLQALYLVNPRFFPDSEAAALAAGGLEILTQARVSDSLDKALKGTTLAIACTARHRDLSHAVLGLRDAASIAIKEANQHSVALVFGTEKSGLTTQE